MRTLAERPWRDRLRRWSAPLRALPDYLIVGTQKGGTSSLHAWLTQHPQVEPSAVKEVHYFDHNYGRGRLWYRAHFPLAPSRWTGRRWISGESSPLYMFDPRCAARIARDVPAVRLIVLLREPAARAWSHHQHNVERGYETLPFAAALAAEPARLAGEHDKLLADPLYRSPTYGRFCYFEKGLYLPQLERFEALFARDRILVLRSEQLFAEPEAAWARTLGFLGLDPLPLPDRRVRNASRSKALDAEVEAALAGLRARYAPHNAALEAHLGTPLGW